jgi:hypothetical protein
MTIIVRYTTIEGTILHSVAEVIGAAPLASLVILLGSAPPPSAATITTRSDV